MVGSAIVRALRKNGFNNIIFKSSTELDLCVQSDVQTFFNCYKPDYVFVAAAKVGGIHANNTKRAEFLYDNLMIQSNVIHSAFLNNVKKLLFLGSSCIYPKNAPQPLKEDYLLSGFLEETNRPYALAKIAGVEMCESYSRQYGSNFISVMPTNLYGPNDNYDLNSSHVLPALLRKIVVAKEKGIKDVSIWGSGQPIREFLHVDDLAEACIMLMEANNIIGPKLINVGSGEEISIKDLAFLIAEIVGYDGNFDFDMNKPDGTMRKLLDSSQIRKLGWSPSINLKKGIEDLILNFRLNETRFE